MHGLSAEAEQRLRTANGAATRRHLQVCKERPLLDPSRESPLACAALIHCKLYAHVCGGIGVGEGSRHGMAWVPRSLGPGATSIENKQMLNKINKKHATGRTRNYLAVLQREIWMVNGV